MWLYTLIFSAVSLLLLLPAEQLQLVTLVFMVHTSNEARLNTVLSTVGIYMCLKLCDGHIIKNVETMRNK